MAGPPPNAPSKISPNGRLVLDRLLEGGRITKDQYESVVLHAQRAGERIEDAIVESGVLLEAELLKVLASIAGTRFVSTEKLAKADVSKAALERVPHKVAEKLMACPILFDAKENALSIVVCDLQAHEVGKQIQLVSQTRQVNAYVARPAAVRASLDKHYLGKRHAFASLTALGSVGVELGFDGIGSPGRSGGSPGGFSFGGFSAADSSPPPLLGVQGPKPVGSAPQSLDMGKPPPPGAAAPGFTIEAPPEFHNAVMEPTVTETAKREIGVIAAAATVSFQDYLDTIGVLVTLLENNREDLRGHSAQVGKLLLRVGERVGLGESELRALTLAAYLHDIGKTSNYHLTALNVSRYEGHRSQAQKRYLIPLRLFEGVGLPPSTALSLTHLYERFDGTGFPDQLQGKTIPLGARALAVVETYTDLTTHARNPFRKILPPAEAWRAIADASNSVFDPDLVEVLKLVVLGDDLREKLLGDCLNVLVVEPDPEESTVLNLRLSEQGYAVRIARDAADALNAAGTKTFDMIVSEVELAPFDGLELLQRLRAGETNSDTPVVFLTRRGERETLNRAYKLGAVDYLIKPASAHVVLAKAQQVLEMAAKRGVTRGVQGSLSEMSLPDVLQILSHGRKTGRLRLNFTGGKSGEIHFSEGDIHHAVLGNVSGEGAFYSMMGFSDGEFSLDPIFRPTNRTIQHSTEALLLEAMRRMDESH